MSGGAGQGLDFRLRQYASVKPQFIQLATGKSAEHPFLVVGRRVLLAEADALSAMAETLGEAFAE